ncbi:MAG: YggS family pyridoxal phosphate-dependent enzyme [Bernardetiaceae bacterium]|nr:YggS family pyridoxal phosphate-dependent enzyme [Bernardetiaceae bacterium]
MSEMLTSNLTNLQEALRPATLVAVSKTYPTEAIQKAYAIGQRDFGENKVQEMCDKAEQLPEDIRWHLIGHLQRNKVKYIVDFVHLIHSVDSLKLLKEIEKRAANAERTVNCLLQVHIAKEDTKFGLDEQELEQIAESTEVAKMQHVKICGLMGMATFTDNQAQVKSEFAYLKSLFDTLKMRNLNDVFDIKILSMGMSGDYQIAIEQGSNMVRIGSAIFGERN